jgi:hypothetical protein
MRIGTVKIAWVAAGIEITADRKQTWVALAGVAESRRVVVDLADPLPGADATAAIVGLWEHFGLDRLAVDPRSPTSTLVEPLQAQGMPLRLADTIAVATAHGRFADYLYADRLRIRGHNALSEAVRAAESRKLAGATAIDRYAATDMAPLMAAELAVWALGDPETAEGIDPGVWVI